MSSDHGGTPDSKPSRSIKGDDRFPLVSIVGGPQGRDVEMRMDGELMRGVTGFQLEGDVRGTLRLRTFQIVKATVAIEAEHILSVTVTVRAERVEGHEGQIVLVGEEEIASSTADTVWDALRDCALQLELAAKKTET